MTDRPDCDELAREVAHELNNHLTALYGHLDMLAFESAAPAATVRLEQMREVLDELRELSRRLQATGRGDSAPYESDLLPTARTATILVIEDDTGVLSTAVSVLAALGYRVLAASSGEEAESLVDDPDVRLDLILTDVGLGEGLGTEVVERIAARRGPVPVVYSTGDADRARRLAPGLAAVPLLPKPYRRLDLARAVVGALEG